MIVSFEFIKGKPSHYFINNYDDKASNLIYKPKKHGDRKFFFPRYTHVFEMTINELDEIESNRANYNLQNDNLVGMGKIYESIAILECDWRNGYIVDSDGFINGNYVIFNDEEPPSYVVMEEPPNTLKKPKWTGVEWVEGYVEEIKKPTELELLQQENEQLKTEIKQHKLEASVTTQAIFELALEIETLKGGV